MIKENAFDRYAEDYDQYFTTAPGVSFHRSMIHRYLQSNILIREGMDILELNCGTGEDALFFGLANQNVLATDNSAEMIKIAKRKCLDLQNVKFLQLDINDLQLLESDSRFDLIFSNFGGLNCLDNDGMKFLMDSSARLLNHGGRFIAILMPRYALWELGYFLLHGQINNAFRRRTGYAEVLLHGFRVPVWYYSPQRIKSIAATHFHCHGCFPVGLFSPPVGAALNRSGRILSDISDILDRICWKITSFSGISDHYLIDLEAYHK